MSDEGLILEIQRMSTEDGPGIRTTVFFKGCSLECTWCHNPESIATRPELVWHDWRCIGCRTCLEICPEVAIASIGRGIEIDRARCTECFSCASECPSAALEVQGRRLSVEEVADEAARDRAYYDASGGGVTLSGGEPTLQAGFAGSLLDRCRALGIATALDTCGQCRQETLIDLAMRSDLVLYDLKDLDPARHERFTGKRNDRVLANLRALADQIRGTKGRPIVWIRTPLIPGATAMPDRIAELGRFLAAELKDVVDRWELCAFNNLCREKYRRLGKTWPHADTVLLTDDRLDELEEVARRSGLDPDRVAATGPTRNAPRPLAPPPPTPGDGLGEGGAGSRVPPPCPPPVGEGPTRRGAA
jgi:pyruvate formate lyase activating enzyme